MTREEQNLLIKDLCTRLPHGVKIRIEYPFLKEEEWHSEILYGLDLQRLCIANTSIRLEEFKPYLFPLSSMTEEQKKEYNRLKHEVPVCYYEYGDVVEEVELFDSPESFEYLIENHFDYRGLIEKGLAIDCTGLNIY